jgi:hypothetical protein
MKNSSEKKKSQTRSSIMKNIGNGNNVSFGVNMTSASYSSFIDTYIQTVLDTAYQNGVNSFTGLFTKYDYLELPGVENRRPKWKYLAKYSNDKWIGAQRNGQNYCATDSKFFMYRDDKRGFIEFTYCQLIGILKNEQNFDPPFTPSETIDWFNTYGRLFCYGISGICDGLPLY